MAARALLGWASSELEAKLTALDKSMSIIEFKALVITDI